MVHTVENVVDRRDHRRVERVERLVQVVLRRDAHDDGEDEDVRLALRQLVMPLERQLERDAERLARTTERAHQRAIEMYTSTFVSPYRPQRNEINTESATTTAQYVRNCGCVASAQISPSSGARPPPARTGRGRRAEHAHQAAQDPHSCSRSPSMHHASSAVTMIVVAPRATAIAGVGVGGEVGRLAADRRDRPEPPQRLAQVGEAAVRRALPARSCPPPAAPSS